MINSRIIAVIPARGGSKGVPRKNLQPVAGIPLVVRAVRAALGSRRVARTVVSTDDDEIATIASDAGAEIVMRPWEMANDFAPLMPTLQHALSHYEARGQHFDGMVVLEPTSPFRTPVVIDSCIDKLFVGSTQSVVTVRALQRNPRYVFQVTGDDAEFFIKDPPVAFYRRQDFTHLKRVNGCVYATRIENIRRGEIIVEPIKVVEMSMLESANIDTPLDLRIAELCAETLRGDGKLSE